MIRGNNDLSKNNFILRMPKKLIKGKKSEDVILYLLDHFSIIPQAIEKLTLDKNKLVKEINKSKEELQPLVTEYSKLRKEYGILYFENSELYQRNTNIAMKLSSIKIKVQRVKAKHGNEFNNEYEEADRILSEFYKRYLAKTE